MLNKHCLYLSNLAIRLIDFSLFDHQYHLIEYPIESLMMIMMMNDDYDDDDDDDYDDGDGDYVSLAC